MKRFPADGVKLRYGLEVKTYKLHVNKQLRYILYTCDAFLEQVLPVGSHEQKYGGLNGHFALQNYGGAPARNASKEIQNSQMGTVRM